MNSINRELMAIHDMYLENLKTSKKKKNFRWIKYCFYKIKRSIN